MSRAQTRIQKGASWSDRPAHIGEAISSTAPEGGAGHAGFWSEESQPYASAAAAGQLDVEAYRLFQYMRTWESRLANVLAAAAADRRVARGSGALLAANEFQAVLDLLKRTYRDLWYVGRSAIITAPPPLTWSGLQTGCSRQPSF